MYILESIGILLVWIGSWLLIDYGIQKLFKRFSTKMIAYAILLFLGIVFLVLHHFVFKKELTPPSFAH